MIKLIKTAIYIPLLLIVCASAYAQDQIPTPIESERGRVVVVSISDRRLALLENGSAKKIYRVAVGKPSTPSPTGVFTVVSRVSDPTYYHAGKVVAPGQGNPVGSRWIGLNLKGYGIHGTNAPNSIGKAASHGCVRMARKDLEELFAQLRTGDRVEILGEPNAETAALFGPAETTQASASNSAQLLAAGQHAPATVETAAGAIPVGQ